MSYLFGINKRYVITTNRNGLLSARNKPIRIKSAHQGSSNTRLINSGYAKTAEVIEIQPLLDAGYEGQKLADQLPQLRIKAIAQHISQTR